MGPSERTRHCYRSYMASFHCTASNHLFRNTLTEWVQDRMYTPLHGRLHCVLCLFNQNLPTVGQSDMIHSILPSTCIDITHITHLQRQASLDKGHLHSGLQQHTQIIVIMYISSVILQGHLTCLQWGFFLLSTSMNLVPIMAITSCGRFQMPPDIEVTLFLKCKVIIQLSTLSGGCLHPHSQ